jgi:hypothetical protein
MRRLLLTLALVAWALPASAQNCVTINGVTRCAAPWQIYDTTVRQLSLPVIDLSQTWNAPGVTFTGLKLNITDTNSASGSLLMDLQVAGVSKFSVSKAGGQSWTWTGLGTTSTDGVSLINATAATSGTTVQISPRLKWRGTAWDTSASETVDFFAEVLPATAATPTGVWKLGYSLNGGAATYPLTVTSAGVMTFIAGGEISSVTVVRPISNGGGIHWLGGTALTSANTDGHLTMTNDAGTIGSRLKMDALPTVASGFGTSPSITAGSTPLAGSVNVGTGGIATSGVINFNGTAFPSAPFVVATTSLTNAVVRATASTTQLTLTSTTAWTASDVITWHAISSK